MQVCFYEIHRFVNSSSVAGYQYELNEINSLHDTIGRKVCTKCFRKVFPNAYYRVSFENTVQGHIEMINRGLKKGTEESHVDRILSTILRNCKASDDIYGSVFGEKSSPTKGRYSVLSVAEFRELNFKTNAEFCKSVGIKNQQYKNYLNHFVLIDELGENPTVLITKGKQVANYQ